MNEPRPVPTGVAAIDSGTARIEHRIAETCLASGLFKLADGEIARAHPGAALTIEAVNAGVDIACAHPELVAADLSSIEWVARELRAEIERRRKLTN